ncbi:hypothetical protein QWY20_16245 [Alkalimonas sp. MEB108]|uniref:Restriction endonuclease type IV Mrr domain-containing protein n=1 Tax=Alkalimonas cellulosilytica TaxID=3058395 RepID=A0ABU7J8Y3_9GAMM|nr:hypothetical protein [Alkalimonas sp. MEB108]MEE2003010.1 hypothetical protein [Alkalimonas sp. MEB108]
MPKKHLNSATTALIIPISDHNIAQLYNCLTSDAHRFVLLASKKYQDHRQRFAGVLQKLRPSSQVDSKNLPDNADCYQALCNFAREDLLPLSHSHRLELNGSGGTKVIPLALLDCLPIERVHYKGQFDDHLQSWQPGNPDSYQEQKLDKLIEAQHALDLYASKTYPLPTQANAFSDAPNAQAMANSIWQQYQDPDSVMSWLAAELASSPWYQPQAKSGSFSISIPETRRQDTDGLQWLAQLADFSQGQLQLKPKQLIIRHQKQKKSLAQQFKRWLSGIWLEDLVHQWLSEHIEPTQLLRGLSPSSTGEQGNQRELDFVCFYQTAGYVIETKVTHKPNQAPNEMVQQLSSLADQFGRLNKVLLLSPLFFQAARTEKALNQFVDYCKGHGVRLCRSKAELLALFNNKKSKP